MKRKMFVPEGFLLYPLVIIVYSAALARGMTFEDRVKAEEAIERVYYSHQIGATRPFEEAVPGSVLEQKLREDGRRADALRRSYGLQVNPEMLGAELERMARETRFSARLLELFGALNNDSVLIQE